MILFSVSNIGTIHYTSLVVGEAKQRAPINNSQFSLNGNHD